MIDALRLKTNRFRSKKRIPSIYVEVKMTRFRRNKKI